MTAPNCGLPTFADTDPACGQDQMAALAQAADTLFNNTRGIPEYPWCAINLGAVTNVAPGATVLPSLALAAQSSHNLFSIMNNQVAVTIAGMYRVQFRYRFIPAGGTSSNFSFYRAVFSAPSGTARVDAVCRSFQTGWQDIDHAAGLSVLRPGLTGEFSANNGTNVAANFGTGLLELIRIGDEW